MSAVWTDAALDDLAAIVAYYLEVANPRVAERVQRRILEAVQSLQAFPERIRTSERVPGTRELIVPKLPFVVFVHVAEHEMVILNFVHTRRRFP